MTIRTRILHGWIGAVVLAGCAQWSAPPATELGRLPLPQLAPDSVVLEVTFIRIPEERADFEERFWPEADEAAISTEVRRRLATNGFRCGLVSSPPPAALQELLDRQAIPDTGDGLQTIEGGKEIAVRTHRLHSRSGHLGKIIVRGSSVPKLAALLHDPEGHVRGESFDQAQFFLSVVSHPQGNGQSLIELTPTIEHGQPRSRFKGQQGAWTVDNVSRATRNYDELKVETTLSPGQCVALGGTTPRRGLGDQFFGADRDEQEPQLLLVVRLAQTLRDERFVPEQSLTPLVTATE